MGSTLKAAAVAFLVLGVAACSQARPETAPEPDPAPAPAEAAAPGAPEEAPPEPTVPAEPAARGAEVSAADRAGAATAVVDAAESALALYEEVRVPADALAVRDFQPDAYWQALEPVLAAAPDRFRVAEAGRSVLGRPIRRIDFGSGPVSVLLWSQMHGNESTASRSLVDLLALLGGSPDDPRVARIEAALTLTVVPVVNPDGAARFQRHNAVGIDINRDARALSTPEGRLLKQIRDDVDADWGFNLHDQNIRTRLGDSDRDVLIALLAPPPGPGATSPENRRARRMCSLLSVALGPVVGDQVARYDESFNPRAFGDLMAAWGTSTVLIESGGELADPHKARLRTANFVALLTALDAIAAGSVDAWGEDEYFGLPLNAPWVHDLVIRQARIVLPGAEPVLADLVVNFVDPLLENRGRIDEVGDLTEARGLREIDATGLFYVPAASALDAGGGLPVGAPATGVLARDAEGRDVVYRLSNGVIEEDRQHD